MPNRGEDMAVEMETILPVYPRSDGAIFDMFVSNPDTDAVSPQCLFNISQSESSDSQHACFWLADLEEILHLCLGVHKAQKKILWLRFHGQ